MIYLDPTNRPNLVARPPRIEAVIVCVHYADYLAETLPENKPHFDWITVVTSNDDKETLELCRRLSVPCYATNKFYTNGGTFNKSAGINHALKYLRYNEQVCQIDADTALSPSAGYWLRKKTLDPNKIYGCDRVECRGWNCWQAYKQENHYGHDFNCRVHFPEGMQILDRIALVNDNGWLPIGYFQCWNMQSSRHYPITEGIYANAERTDVAHGTQWDETDRVLLGEFFAIHLTTEQTVSLGSNWNGRTTMRFGPK